jgi:predicted Zn-dependent protease
VVERAATRAEPQRRFTVRLEPAETCRFDVHLVDQEAISATATGRGIAVTKGLMWFARLVARGAMRQIEVEAAADYLGLYIMARAAYDIAEAPQFWRRIAANFPHMMAQAATHPGTSYRYVAMTKAVDEIKSKLAAGGPLMPGLAPALARAADN